MVLYAKRTERVRGRAGVALRKARLQAEPLCKICKAKGKTKIADVIDHIKPLSTGGTDADDNIQSLCNDCHAIKTAGESNLYQASNHPTWLEPSAIPLTIVCGPPASGKTTYTNNHAKPNDIVIDLDSIMSEIKPGHSHWSKTIDKALINHAIRIRNSMLSLLKKDSGKAAWFIVSAPCQAEREWWSKKLGGTILLLDPGIDECKRRALSRGTPLAIAGVDKWHNTARKPWTAPEDKPAKVKIGLDGWPIE